MQNGKRYCLIIFGLLCSILCSAQVLPGKSPKNPFTFGSLQTWLGDPRPAMELFEETLKKDFLASRLNARISLTPSYFLMADNQVFQAYVNHFTFQGMFWGTAFAMAMWLPPAAIMDLLFDAEGTIVSIPIELLKTGLEGMVKQSREEISIADLFRINVLFTSDIIFLDFMKYGSDLHAMSDFSLLGRSFAGLCFKILEANSFFAGFKLIHFPHIAGWDDFIAGEESFSTQVGISVYDKEGAYLLFETRAKILLYDNFLDLFALRTLFNIGGSHLLDMFGITLTLDKIIALFDWAKKFDFLEKIKSNLTFSYLDLLENYTFEWDGTFYLAPDLDFFYKYDMTLYPFSLLTYARAGIYCGLGSGLALKAYALVFRQDTRYKFGFLAEAGFNLPFTGKLNIGIGYNADETMGRMEIQQDTFTINLKMEIGMLDTGNPFKKELLK